MAEKKYDLLLVGAGLYNGVIAHQAVREGKRVLVLEKRPHIGGNLYCEEIAGIQVHTYGAHIFHTSDEEVWRFVTDLVPFNRFTNSPVANYKGQIYNLPFNMNTFRTLWGVRTPDEARAVIEEQRREITGEPKNLEEQAISLVGRDVYEKLVKGYTEKQWGRPCTELPAFIIRRLPVRFTYDNNYFNDRYQGIPEDGYNTLMEKLFEGCDVITGVDFLDDKDGWRARAAHTVFTGPIDRYFDGKLGWLAYRSLRFETEVLDTDNYQGVAVVNYTEREVPYTRIIEHKHFAFGTQEKTVITREYPAEYAEGREPYYPVNDDRNGALYARYRALAETEEGVTFGGRLGLYSYLDMDKIVRRALDTYEVRLRLVRRGSLGGTELEGRERQRIETAKTEG